MMIQWIDETTHRAWQISSSDCATLRKYLKGGIVMVITPSFICIWGSIIAGLASAGLWFRAATVVAMKGDPGTERDIFLGGVAIQTTVQKQSRYNQYAAGA